MATKTWTDERVEALVAAFPEGTYVTQEAAGEFAEKEEISKRSVTSKLRKMGYDVQLASEIERTATFTDEMTSKLEEILDNHSGEFTFREIGEQLGVDYRKVQGKVLSLERTDDVKPAPPKQAEKKYTEAEETKFVEMANAGAFMEDIAEALGRAMNSARGKALSLLRAGVISSIPKQRDVKQVVDEFTALGDVSQLTVQEIADKLGKSARGVKTMLTRRGVSAKDYDGAAKAEKLALAG